MKNLFKKITIVFALITLLFSAYFVPVVNAQDSSPGTWYDQSFPEWWEKVYGSPDSEIFGERYTAAQVQWVVYGLFALILRNTSGSTGILTCLMSGDLSACTGDIQNALDSLSSTNEGNTTGQKNDESLLKLVFARKSMSGIYYIKDRIARFSPVKEAEAQSAGYGFKVLEPIQPLWRATRNAAYALLTIVVVVFAFMIMFRVKINPQTVVSVQSSIPKVVSALILITFSYAIAGFLIDLIYVVIGILSLIIGSIGSSNPNAVYTLMTTGAPWIGGGILGVIAMYSVLFFWTLLATMFSGHLLTNFLLGPFILFMFFLLIIIAGVMLFIIFCKTLWLLLKTLTMFYLQVIAGPLMILFGTVSGKGAGSWIKGVFANLAVYPTIGAMYAMSFVFLFYGLFMAFGAALDQSVFNHLFDQVGIYVPSPQEAWSPPLTLGESYLPLLFVGVSFVIITITPKTAEIIKGMLEGKPYPLGTAIGENVSQAAGLAKAGINWQAARKEKMDQETVPEGQTYVPDPWIKAGKSIGLIER